MLDKINGLPAHVLLIHLVVVLVPGSALMLVASALWPAARAKLGFLTPAVALVALVLVPITTDAGEWLRDHLPAPVADSAAVRRHTDLGDTLLPWAIAIFVMAAVVWVLGRRFELSWRNPGSTPAPGPASVPGSTSVAVGRRVLPVWATALIALVAVVVAVGGTVQLYRIGDSGAKAVWSGVASD